MSFAFADVALPVPLDQPFTYALAQGMVAAPGMRVRAPWGSRRLEGVITALYADLPAGLEAGKVKPLAAVLDNEPLLDAAMLELVRWTAAYYQAPIGEVMRCALPPPGEPGARRQRIYRLEIGGDTEPAGPKRRITPAQQCVIELLRAAGGAAAWGLIRDQASPSALATLCRRGWISCLVSDAPPARAAWEPRPRVTQLNPAQTAALAAIVEALPYADTSAAPLALPTLLHGVTGSGKTAIYLEAIAAALERNRSALLLVPEIGLTPAVFADFQHAFPMLVAILHSGLSPGERAAQWHRLHRGEARVAIGTRSAVFAPLPRLGLIIVDEEHDASFKQQESPRYHARDIAVLRGKLGGAAVVLGSATPSLESVTRARQGKYRLVTMTQRVERRPLPSVRVIDMGEEFRHRAGVAVAGASRPPESGGGGSSRRPREENAAIFSAELLQALADRVERGQQSLLLINRRGWAPVVLCRACGAAVMCRDCELAMTYHRHDERLLCHFCGYSAPPPRLCSACASEHLYFLGAGSEQVEAELARHLPSARLARLDRDTARRRGHFEKTLGEFRAGGLDILIGTQMIAKGHDLPGVTLVGVLQADLGLTFPDFRAAERTYQLLTQVAGRAGRGAIAGEVLLQALHPRHYAVEAAAHDDFNAFYEKEANFRRWMHYPPFASMALVQLRHRDRTRLQARVDALAGYLERRAPAFPQVRILGPAPALVARLKTEYRFQFLFKSAARRDLHILLRSVREFARAQHVGATELIVDVDPLNL